MINLSFLIQGNFNTTKPFVCKIDKHQVNQNSCSYDNDLFSHHLGTFTFKQKSLSIEEGEILIVFPIEKFVSRFFRPSANSNTILLTENCDQKCVMCSQPPKNKDYIYFDLYKEASLQCPKDTVIGISGGEPTLFKDKLLTMINEITDIRSDLKFHILSNGQHFKKEDHSLLQNLNNNILWGIPLYSSFSLIHDQTVNKEDAFNILMKNFDILANSGSRIEMRTVLMKNNIHDLPNLANLISSSFSWIEIWAIMQLENIGYAKMNWDQIFFDNSIDFKSLNDALMISKIFNINTKLYNFPKCTVPFEFQDLVLKSISDWKQKYLNECESCNEKINCCGFFEWYDKGYTNLKPFN